MINSITVLGKKYQIIYGDDIALCGSSGICNRERQVIKINKELACDQLNETLLHEVIHIIDMELKLQLTEPDVCRLAVGLYSAGYYQSMQDEDLEQST